MLLCQDEGRNSSRKINAAKKKRGAEVKIGRRKEKLKEDKDIHLHSLIFLINRYP